MIIGRRYAGNEFATAKQLAFSVIRRSADHRALANGSFAAKESQVGSQLLESLDATPMLYSLRSHEAGRVLDVLLVDTSSKFIDKVL